jgi:predicted GNAT family acetyltransferase
VAEQLSTRPPRGPYFALVVTVVDNSAESRLEARVGDSVGYLIYRIVGDRLVLVHTEVPPQLEGQGVGGALVTAGLDLARERGLTVVARCPFARSWLERHPDALKGR